MSRGVLGGTLGQNKDVGTSWWNPNEVWNYMTVNVPASLPGGDRHSTVTRMSHRERGARELCPVSVPANLKLDQNDAHLSKSAHRSESGQEASGEGEPGGSARAPQGSRSPGKGTSVSAAGRGVHRGAWGARASACRKRRLCPTRPGILSSSAHLLFITDVSSSQR